MRRYLVMLFLIGLIFFLTACQMTSSTTTSVNSSSLTNPSLTSTFPSTTSSFTSTTLSQTTTSTTSTTTSSTLDPLTVRDLLYTRMKDLNDLIPENPFYHYEYGYYNSMRLSILGQIIFQNTRKLTADADLNQALLYLHYQDSNRNHDATIYDFSKGYVYDYTIKGDTLVKTVMTTDEFLQSDQFQAVQEYETFGDYFSKKVFPLRANYYIEGSDRFQLVFSINLLFEQFPDYAKDVLGLMEPGYSANDYLVTITYDIADGFQVIVESEVYPVEIDGIRWYIKIWHMEKLVLPTSIHPQRINEDRYYENTFSIPEQCDRIYETQKLHQVNLLPNQSNYFKLELEAGYYNIIPMMDYFSSPNTRLIDSNYQEIPKTGFYKIPTSGVYYLDIQVLQPKEQKLEFMVFPYPFNEVGPIDEPNFAPQILSGLWQTDDVHYFYLLENAPKGMLVLSRNDSAIGSIQISDGTITKNLWHQDQIAFLVSEGSDVIIRLLNASNLTAYHVSWELLPIPKDSSDLLEMPEYLIDSKVLLPLLGPNYSETFKLIITTPGWVQLLPINGSRGDLYDAFVYSLRTLDGTILHESSVLHQLFLEAGTYIIHVVADGTRELVLDFYISVPLE